LKWQALDLNLQRRFALRQDELLRLKDEKLRVIFGQMEARVDREVMLDVQHSSLEEEAETMLALADLPRTEVRSLLYELQSNNQLDNYNHLSFENTAKKKCMQLQLWDKSC